jgi:hypothetical protein
VILCKGLEHLYIFSVIKIHDYNASLCRLAHASQVIAFLAARERYKVKVLAGTKSKLRVCPVFVIFANYDPDFFPAGMK